MHAPPSTSADVSTPAETGETLRRPLRVALAHDWLVGYRGGEAVLHHIITALESANRPTEITRLYTMFDDGRPLTPQIDALPRRASKLNALPARLRRWLLPFYPGAIAGLSKALAQDHAREPIDLLISTSSAAIKNLMPPAGIPHLCYCHTPPRYIWQQSEQYDRGLRGLGLTLLRPSYKRWDKDCSGVTRFLANSTHTAAEIRRCYGKVADVLHPPVRTDFFTPDDTVQRGDHWLYAGALEPYKRVDLAIRAANLKKHPLTIVGDGSQRTRLAQLAGPTVTFAGRVSDEQLRDHYRRARLLLFPQIEDFGIVAPEALACNTPVVARAAGGALDTVTPTTVPPPIGAFFQDPTPDALLEAIANCPDPSPACQSQARRFAAARFEQQLTSHIQTLLS